MSGHGVTDEELRSVLAAAPSHPRATDVSSELIVSEPAASATAGIWRFASGEWSAVLKVLRRSTGGSRLWQSGTEVDHWYYWRREADAYASGVLDVLGGGVRAPRCLGVADRPDGSVAIWLEDLGSGRSAAVWDVARYRVGAVALGRAQAATSGIADPDGPPWLARDWLRRFVDQRSAFVRAARSPGWRHPMATDLLPRDARRRVVAIWEHRHRLLEIVASAPRCLTHNDLHPGNLFALGSDTVLIDWGFLGIGRLGEDPGNLVVDAVLDFFVSPDHFTALDEAVTEGYLDGVGASCSTADLDGVRRAVWATGALRCFWIPLSMVEALAEGRTTLNRRPIEEAFAHWARLVPHILERADRALSA